MTHLSRNEVINNLRNKRNELEAKLEAIQVVVDTTYNIDTLTEGYIPTKGMYKIKKILEDSEFTTNSEDDKNA